LYIVNFRLQKVAIYVEIAKTEVVKQFKTHNMTFLDRFGVIGEYLKLEMKSTVRNLVVRKQFITGSLCMLMLCGLFSFSDIYDDWPFMQVFICMYCFTCFGVMTLTTVMCVEGNYIDGLMVRRETVLSLLKAKYYYQCLMLIVPLLFSLMPIMEGKITWLTALGCLLFTAGAVFPFIFQLAVYNKQTLPLQQKVTGKGNIENGMQIVIEMIALSGPGIIAAIGFVLVGETSTFIFMAVLGLGFMVTHPLWIRHIYNRMMKRRYENLEGFHTTRE
jgi:hypothetical protein